MPRVKIGAALPDRATLDVEIARLRDLDVTELRSHWQVVFGRPTSEGVLPMKTGSTKVVRCAIYTRVSTDQGLEQDFNSLDAQYEASQAYIRSQAHAGWTLLRAKYDDGGFSGGHTDRPALQRLLEDVRSGKIDVIVVYKVDRLTRSLADFAKLVELFDEHNVSFVSVTQQFNTTTSMGRLTLNVLLSFAQFEREVTSERIRDKISASKRIECAGRKPTCRFTYGHGTLVAGRIPSAWRAATARDCSSALPWDSRAAGPTWSDIAPPTCRTRCAGDA